MAAELHYLCLLAILSVSMARPPYLAVLTPQSLVPYPNEEPQHPRTLYYPPEDIGEVAARKRNYQAAFAALASQMAAQSRLFGDTAQDSDPTQSPALHTNTDLHHRNIIHHPRVFTKQTSVLFSAVVPATGKLLPRDGYILNTVEDPSSSHVLTNGFLPNTPEVEAARRQHLTAVAMARSRSTASRSYYRQ